jgi:hypothetical protein
MASSCTAYDKPSLVYMLRDSAMTMLCTSMQQTFEGLSQAARKAHERGSISSKLKTKLINIDIAYNYVRHVDMYRNANFLEELRCSLAGEQGKPVSGKAAANDAWDEAAPEVTSSGEQAIVVEEDRHNEYYNVLVCNNSSQTVDRWSTLIDVAVQSMTYTAASTADCAAQTMLESKQFEEYDRQIEEPDNIPDELDESKESEEAGNSFNGELDGEELIEHITGLNPHRTQRNKVVRQVIKYLTNDRSEYEINGAFNALVICYPEVPSNIFHDLRDRVMEKIQ